MIALSFAQGVRLYFLAFYTISVLIVLVQVLPAAFRAGMGQHRPRDGRRHLPVILLPIAFLVPLGMIFFRIGEVQAEWTIVRILGVLVSLYAIVLLPSSAATLGRFLVPQAVVFENHELVTHGPFRYVRHPAYAGDLALWLSAALGTLNLPLLVLWPLYVLGVSAEARVEEELLQAKFGSTYRDYANRSGRFLPRLGASSS